MTSTTSPTPNTRIMSSQPSIRNENDTNDWVTMIRESNGVFDEEILRRHYSIYGAHSGPLTSSQIHGLKEWYQTHMRVLRMRHSLATSNRARYTWLCQHYIREERRNVNPRNYHVFPFRRFFDMPKFYRYFFGTFFDILDRSWVKFILSMYLMYKMHTWSHILYMMPIPILKMAYPCSELPMQPACDILNFVQRNTFDGIRDMNKTLVTLAMTWFVSFLTSLLSTRRFKQN